MSDDILVSRKAQQLRLKKQVSKTDCHAIFNLLTSPELFDKVESLLPSHRERIFPPTEALSMFVAQTLSQDRSCQNAVNQAAVKSVVSGMKPCSTNTGGYCRARQRLPLEMPKKLALFIGNELHQKALSSWQWQGRRVLLVDGTTMTMPDTAENQEVYPQQRGQKPGLGFPISRLLAITDLSTGAVVDLAFGSFKGKGSNEHSLLRSLSSTFESGDMILGDAFFPSYSFIALMLGKGADILMVQNGMRRRKTDFRRGKSLGVRDHIVEIERPKQRIAWMSMEQFYALPKKITMREFKANGKVMVTTMTDVKKAPKKELAKLYKRRWEIETSFDQIKTIIGMNILSCKTPAMIAKEVWVCILAYNLIRLLMAAAAQSSGQRPSRLSFKHCLQLWLNYLQQTATLDDLALRSLLILMSQQCVGNRPNRVEPRAVKRRPKIHPSLKVAREEARVSIRKNGHPVKLK